MSQIWVIDDDIDFSALLVKRFKKSLNIEVRTFRTGRDGLDTVAKSAATELPGLFCVDLQLPDLSGFEVCSLLRSDVRLKKTPVFIVSARNSLQDHARALDVGATEFLEKPVRLNALEDRVKKHLKLA